MWKTPIVTCAVYIKTTSSAVEIFKLSLDLLSIKGNCTALFVDKCIGYLFMFQKIFFIDHHYKT